MTQANERAATLSEMVAEEIRALMARRKVSGRELASQLGVSPSWISYRLSGKQPIDLNDMLLIANALGVGVHQLLPAPENAAKAAPPRTTHGFQTVTDRASMHIGRPVDNRPGGHPSSGSARTDYLDRPGRRRRGR